MLTKDEIIIKLKELKPFYFKEGIEIIGLFGSYARNEQNEFSDIDIAYRINHEEIKKHYTGGFQYLIRLDEIKDELGSIFKKGIDFIPDENKKILKDIIYV